jgi:hypothetical protein
MGTFPIDWFKLSIEKSLIFTLFNVIFWTLIVFLGSLTVMKILKKT